MSTIISPENEQHEASHVQLMRSLSHLTKTQESVMRKIITGAVLAIVGLGSIVIGRKSILKACVSGHNSPGYSTERRYDIDECYECGLS